MWASETKQEAIKGAGRINVVMNNACYSCASGLSPYPRFVRSNRHIIIAHVWQSQTEHISYFHHFVSHLHLVEARRSVAGTVRRLVELLGPCSADPTICRVRVGAKTLHQQSTT